MLRRMSSNQFQVLLFGFMREFGFSCLHLYDITLGMTGMRF